MADTHEYPVTATWSGGRSGSGLITGNQSGIKHDLSVPKEFGGPGAGTNPEELLAMAIAGCYTITFGIIAETRKIPVQHVETEAIGAVEGTGANLVYTRVTLRPRIILAADATDDQLALADQMAHKADLYCLVTNAVRDKVQITVEPTITRG